MNPHKRIKVEEGTTSHLLYSLSSKCSEYADLYKIQSEEGIKKSLLINFNIYNRILGNSLKVQHTYSRKICNNFLLMGPGPLDIFGKAKICSSSGPKNFG